MLSSHQICLLLSQWEFSPASKKMLHLAVSFLANVCMLLFMLWSYKHILDMYVLFYMLYENFSFPQPVHSSYGVCSWSRHQRKYPDSDSPVFEACCSKGEESKLKVRKMSYIKYWCWCSKKRFVNVAVMVFTLISFFFSSNIRMFRVFPLNCMIWVDLILIVKLVFKVWLILSFGFVMIAKTEN